jgi:hypothetical protein
MKVLIFLSLIIYAALFIASFLTSIIFGESQISPLTNYISELSLSQYSPLPYLYDLGCIISGSLTIPITFYIKKTTFHDRNVQKFNLSNRESFKILGHAGFISGLVGDVSFIGVGIFSLQRNVFGIHYLFAYLLFFGYILTALFVGLIILLYQTKLSTLMGLSGVLYPFVILALFLYTLICVPSLLIFYEWFVSISLTIWLFLFSIYFLHSKALFKP